MYEWGAESDLYYVPKFRFRNPKNGVAPSDIYEWGQEIPLRKAVMPLTALETRSNES